MLSILEQTVNTDEALLEIAKLFFLFGACHDLNSRILPRPEMLMVSLLKN